MNLKCFRYRTKNKLLSKQRRLKLIVLILLVIILTVLY